MVKYRLFNYTVEEIMKLLKYRIKTFLSYKDLIEELVKRDIKLKYRRSFLGYLWTILQPLLIMIVMTIVFSTILGKGIENYPVYLFSGRMLFDFMKTGTNSAMKSVTKNASLIEKVYIPKYIFTFSTVTSSMIDTALSIGALLIVMVATGAKFYWTLILYPIVMFQTYLFVLGLGFFLAQMNVFFRDMEHIWGAVTTAWFYLTLLIYLIDRLPENIQMFIKIGNPMYYYVAQARDVIYYGNIPGARIFWGGWIIAIAMLIIGIWSFQRSEDRFFLYI